MYPYLYHVPEQIVFQVTMVKTEVTEPSYPFD